MPEAINEIIWHFAGYFRISEDIARDRLEYLDGALRLNSEDYTLPLPESPFRVDGEPFETRPYSLPITTAEGSGGPFAVRLRAHRPDPAEEPDDVPVRADPRVVVPTASGGGGGSGGGSDTDRDISVVYQNDGSQLLAEIRQFNIMLDNDHLLVTPGTGATELNNVDIEGTLQAMTEAAVKATPAEVALPQDGAEAVEFIKAHDKETEESGGEPSAHSTAPGIYVNGELQGSDFVFTLPDLSPPDDTVQPVTTHGESASLGSNTAVNAALIVDLNEGSPTMMVLGNFFSTEAIVQTWSFADNDKVSVGGSELSDIITGDNSAQNIAEFDHQPGVYPDLTGYFSGWMWDVDVVEGDFYDIQLLVQSIFLSDNDVTVQDTQQSHYAVHTGENQQFNLAELFGGDFEYDLIIIGGDYHGGNYIFQHLFLLDDDIAMMAATSGEPAQTIGTGGNELLNHAMIQTHGNETFIPLSEQAKSLATALQNQETGLDPEEYGFIAPGVGEGPLNVLYVTGDYYDINAIWQYITIADADTALQLLDGEQALIGAEGLTQSIQTGGNTLVNDAAIIDVGPNTTHVGGDVYTDTILVQAELVSEDDDKIVHDDTGALVNELIAFIGPDADDPTQPAPSVAPQPYDDPISGVVA